MTARQAYEYALALMDEIKEDGTADAQTTAGYAGKAPRLIDMLHRDLAGAEGKTVTEAITSLSDALIISDDTAARILPFGLAAKFALSDRDAASYNEFSTEYKRQKRTIPGTQSDIADEYGILSGIG